MVSVIRVHLPSEIPFVGRELTPYVLVRRPDKSLSTDDVPESSPLEGHFVRYRWYRVEIDKKVTICCSVHPKEEATVQCLFCAKRATLVAKSYHCTPKCITDSWDHHMALHEYEENELVSMSNLSISNNGSAPLYPSIITQKSEGEKLIEVGSCKSYTPTADDIGYVLKFECVVANAETKQFVGQISTILTSRVIPAHSPCSRKLIPVNGVGYLDHEGRIQSAGSFTVLSYNILSDSSASSGVYSYCPSWALSWPYRRQNLLREIVGYRADVVCLQDVQSDHFHGFFAPELDKHGYQAIYKRKTNGVLGGCAMFYRRDRFTHVKKYDAEFNKAAHSLTESLIPQAQKRTALTRLVTDNIAMIIFLEPKFGNQPADPSGKKQLICVANTHVSVEQELKDVKLWQVHTLIKGLEKSAGYFDIPIVLCGDFNSLPGSAVHSLLRRNLHPSHPDLLVDPLQILRPHTKLMHPFPLVSAYSPFARLGAGPGLEQHRRRMDPNTNEPLFTNYTRDFIGTQDYIFYTGDSLMVESLLELLDEDGLRKNTALPSPEWSSSHIALLAEFRCIPRTRR